MTVPTVPPTGGEDVSWQTAPQILCGLAGPETVACDTRRVCSPSPLRAMSADTTFIRLDPLRVDDESVLWMYSTVLVSVWRGDDVCSF